MELWIRSQDKESLIKVEEIELIYDCLCSDDIQIVHIETDKGIIGSYATKERALEILNEIHQNIIDLQTIEIEPKCIETIPRSINVVYEMPKE